MQVYTIIAGVNGAGKSSLTGALKAERNDLGQIIDEVSLAYPSFYRFLKKLNQSTPTKNFPSWLDLI